MEKKMKLYRIIFRNVANLFTSTLNYYYKIFSAPEVEEITVRSINNVGLIEHEFLDTHISS